jgi:hypothetical protein
MAKAKTPTTSRDIVIGALTWRLRSMKHGEYAIILTFTSVAFTYPWLIIIIYALVYLIALVLRLSKVAYDAPGALNQEQTLEEANETLASEKTRVGLMLFWGNHPR